MNLMIVESPNKVKTIQQILGSGWEVAASAGHIRDLPRQSLGVDLETFALQYQFVPGQKQGNRTFAGGKDRVAKLARKVKAAKAVYLATDPDREGEAIAWHLKDALGLKPGQYRRVRFDAIDRPTIERALAEAGDIDTALVAAQEARRALDRLVGYTVSPLLSDALANRLSAGRVQSPALRYVVEREREIRNFREVTHFGATLSFAGGTWTAEWHTKPYRREGERYILDRTLAETAASVRDLEVVDARSGTKSEHPPAPFSTSTLLQAASVALKFDPQQTAKIAQRLFEAGAITYHRTDSINLADETIAELRGFAEREGLPLADAPRRFKSRGDAQEAHEAIRPKHFKQRVLDEGSDEERALYALIWQRAVASQMAPAKYKANEVMLAGVNAGQTFHFRASGRVLIEPGWRALTQRAAEHDEAVNGTDRANDRESGAVPKLAKGTRLEAEDGRVVTKRTQPPKRYTQATLIKALEAGGVGRPSTYPAIMSNIARRKYVTEKKRYLHPTELGEALIDGLIEHGFSFVDPGFTRDMESELDAIARGEAGYRSVVAKHYRRLDQEAQALGGIGTAIAGGRPGGQPPTDASGNPYPCPECGAAMRRIARKDGSHFWGCSDYMSGCKDTMDDDNGRPVARSSAKPPTDGNGDPYPCPECGAPMRRISRKGKSNDHFWGCTDYRNGCKGTMDDDNGRPVARAKPETRTDEHGKPYPCPECGAALRRIPRNDGGYFWGCSEYKSGCKGTMDDDDGRPIPPRGKAAQAGFFIG